MNKTNGPMHLSLRKKHFMKCVLNDYREIMNIKYAYEPDKLNPKLTTKIMQSPSEYTILILFNMLTRHLRMLQDKSEYGNIYKLSDITNYLINSRDEYECRVRTYIDYVCNLNDNTIIEMLIPYHEA